MLFAKGFEPLVVKGYQSVLTLCFAHVFNSDLHGRKRDVLLHCHIVEQVELLKHHTHFFTLFVDVDFEVGKVYAVKHYLARSGIFKAIQATQKRGFSAAAGTDNNHPFALVYRFGDVVKNKQIAEFFCKIYCTQHNYASTI